MPHGHRGSCPLPGVCGKGGSGMAVRHQPPVLDCDAGGYQGVVNSSCELWASQRMVHPVRYASMRRDHVGRELVDRRYAAAGDVLLAHIQYGGDAERSAGQVGVHERRLEHAARRHRVGQRHRSGAVRQVLGLSDRGRGVGCGGHPDQVRSQVLVRPPSRQQRYFRTGPHCCAGQVPGSGTSRGRGHEDDFRQHAVLASLPPHDEDFAHRTSDREI
mmetsp:Transcript_43489/g.102736  ORF Transcript_43489/g.102736 Transcript_43489/m.102736 type:complete len:216 (-) Transcript_43489:1389-2036(-)